jgi:hypothetical protein
MNNDQLNPLNQPIDTPEKTPIPMPFQFDNPQGVTPTPVPSKRRNKKLIVGIIIAVVIIILGAGSVLAYNFWYQNPEKVVSDGVMNALKAKTITFTGSVNIVSDASNVKLEVDGTGDKTKGDVNIKATFDVEGQPITLNGSGLMDGDGNLYFKVKNVKDMLKTYRAAIPVASQNVFDQLIAKIDDRWVKISANDMKQFSEENSKAQKCVGDTIKKFQNDKAATDEIANIYKKNKFLTIEQNLGTKDGSLGYTIKGSDAGAKSFVKALKDTRVFKALHDCDPSFTIDENNAVGSDKKAVDETHVELWVSQWSHEITKISAKDETGPEKSTFVFEPVFNKAVTVTVPEKSVTINELKTEIETLVQSVYVGVGTA